MSSPSKTQKKEKRRVPPKRGQIKGQIFENLIKSVVSMVSKAGETGETSGGTSASATPPASAYNSDGNPSI
ncbi:hypothetical protein FNV43_RR04418 [Rhamnella rubrinervis]|uniref:Uncharacterized protein n=1 Tax=Rhamnella rubrinervis TaxID=2594499 RepID=A0A8K0HJI5_9ROSA|nr:hypothetical protein FNV43_RR04418 [Rhamnella rubrinervis]